MTRFTCLAVLFSAGVIWIADVGAQGGGPPPDPDAKGTVAIVATVPANATKIDVAVTTSVANGWTIKGVTVFAMERLKGGYIVPAVAAVNPADATKWTATISPLPNDLYFVWAIMSVGEVADPDQKQLIGSNVFNGANVNSNVNPPIAPLTNKVDVTVTTAFTRVGGGTQVIGAGKAALTDPKWDLQGIADKIRIDTIPVQGGLVRSGIPNLNPAPPNGLTYNWNQPQPGISVPLAFQYNIIPTAAVGLKNGGPGTSYTAGAPWQKK